MVSLSPSGKVALDEFIVRCYHYLQLPSHNRTISTQVKIIEEKKLPCVTYGVSTIDDEEIYFNYGGFNSVDDSSSGGVNKDSIFRICSQTKLITHVRYCLSLFFRRYYFIADHLPFIFFQLAALQLIEKGELKADSPVSAYLPVFENPIILDESSAENASFKPATKVVLVEHLLNFSSGLFYPEITVLPHSYTAKQDEEDPVGHFYNLIKVSLPLRSYKISSIYFL